MRIVLDLYGKERNVQVRTGKARQICFGMEVIGMLRRGSDRIVRADTATTGGQRPGELWRVAEWNVLADEVRSQRLGVLRNGQDR